LRSKSFAALLALALVAPALAEEAAPSIELAGDLPKKGPLTLEELKALGPSTETWSVHGQSHKVTGVRLDRVMAARGFAPGRMGEDVPKNEKRAGWRKVVLVTASDGFQALLSCAEIAEHMGRTVALLAWEVDGAPLEKSKGPLRLVVLTDQEPSRSIYGVRRIEIVDVPALANRK
jgi:hypothetical protein